MKSRIAFDFQLIEKPAGGDFTSSSICITMPSELNSTEYKRRRQRPRQVVALYGTLGDSDCDCGYGMEVAVAADCGYVYCSGRKLQKGANELPLQISFRFAFPYPLHLLFALSSKHLGMARAWADVTWNGNELSAEVMWYDFTMLLLPHPQSIIIRWSGRLKAWLPCN